MRTTIITIAIVLAIATCIALAVYLYHPPDTTDMAILRDVTEKQLVRPNTAEILGLCDLSGDKRWNGVRLIFSDVTDVSYNEAQEVKIEAANPWFSNEMERGREVQDFKNKVAVLIAQTANDTVGRPHSSIYLPMARELAALSGSKSGRRMLIIYSDLMENDPELSFYDSGTLQEMQSDPDWVKQIFEKWQSLPALTGIDVYLIFQPENAAQDEQYKVVSEFYRKLLQEKGAMVHVSANLLN